MTRDGVFLVENGKIVKAVKDFRWNWRPFELFSAITGMGKAARRAYGTVPPVIAGPVSYPFTD
jgi:predicted Zn-dependent protease